MKILFRMPLHLYNTMSGKIEEFRTLSSNEVRMYACGPTVYDYGHIGNFRTFVAVDILRRYLRQSGFNVRHVMNITDVDDKIIRNSAKAGLSVKEYTTKYEKAFLEDAATLNIEQPILVRATEHIEEMAQFIAKLETGGIRLSCRRWLLLFPHRQVSWIRQTLQERFRRNGRRRPCRCGRVRKRQRA